MKDDRSYKIIGCAMEVHRELGHGFLEGVYQEALEREFKNQQIPFKSQPTVSISYKGQLLDKTYQPDFVCYEEIIVETKAIKGLCGVEEAQIINYLKATGFEVGLLINFGAPSLEYRRFVHGSQPPIHRLQGFSQIRENEDEKGEYLKGVREGRTCYDSQIARRYNSGDIQSVKSAQSADDVGWKIWSRLEVSRVVGKGNQLHFRRPLSLDVAFDEQEKEFVLEFPDLNIFLSAYRPEELYKAFCEDIVWLWEEYVECEERTLSEDAMRLRRRMLDLLQAE